MFLDVLVIISKPGLRCEIPFLLFLATLADEDGVVKEYDEKTALHTVQWDGGTNVDPKEVGTGDLIKHQLMLTAKMMQTFDEGSEKWMKSREVLVKWYLDEDEAAYAYPPMKSHEFPHS